MTFVACRDQVFIKLVLLNIIKHAKGSLDNIFQDSFNKTLSQQLTHVKSYFYQNKLFNPQTFSTSQFRSSLFQIRKVIDSPKY